MSEYCANCGSEIPEEVAICDNCGMPVSEAAPPREAPSSKASARPPQTPPLAEQSASNRRSWLEQGERLPPSRDTSPESAPAQDQNGGERLRGAPRWVVRAAGLARTTARRAPRWAMVAAAGLLGMVAFRRRGIDALEQSSAADRATHQNMSVAETAVQDPALTDQADLPPNLVDGLAPASAAAEPVGPRAPLEASMLGTLKDDDEVVEAIKENPDTSDVLRQDPALISQIQRDPAAIDERATMESSAPTLDPKLLDPTADGPTLDTGLVERIEQNPELVDAVNRDSDIAVALERDPTSIDQIEQYLGIAERRSTELSGSASVGGATEVSIAEPDAPEPDPRDQDLDDQANS